MLDEKKTLSKNELESAKVLAASLQFTRNEVKKVKTDLIESFKEITDPATGDKVKVLEIVGRKGLKGERGEDGKHGPIGSMGPRGPEGVPGKMGPQGIQGTIGLTGSQGPEGLTGAAGIDGDDADVSEVSSQVARLKTRLNLLASSTGHLSTHTGWGEYVGGGGGAQPDGENLGNPSTSEYRPFSTLKSGANSTLQFYKAIGNNGIQFVRNGANTGYYAQIDSSATINVSSFNITSTSASLNVAGLTSLANTVPKANVTYDLGSPQLYWKNVYAQAIVTTGDLQLGDDSTDTVTIGADIGSDIIPNTDSTYDLGNTTHRWSTIFTDEITVTSLSSGGVTANSTEVDITTTTLDVNANLVVHSTLLANSTNVTLAGTSGTISSNATFSANVTTTGANVYINGTDLLVTSNTRLPSITANTTEVDITTTTLDVNANLAVHDTLTANSTNVTLAGTSGTISSNATFSANITTSGANVYINGTDLLVTSNTRLPSITANTTEVDITTTTFDVNANLAVHSTLLANSTNVTLAGTSGTISSNATFSANITTSGSNVYINGTDLTVISNTTLPSFTANTTEVDITTTTFDVNANLAVHSTLTANSTNVTLAGTSGTISSNATFAANLTTTGANVYINGTDLLVTSNVTTSGSNVYINTTDLLVKANTRQTANVTFSGANVVLTSHVSGSGIEERIQDVTAAMFRNTADPSSTYAGNMVGLKITYDDTNGELDITNEIATHPYTEAGHAHPQIADFGLVTEDLISGIQMLEFLRGVTSRAFDLGAISASSSLDISNGLLP
jgi:hypothetical protein